MSEPKVRLADIAKDTGYSLATVSKALNGRSDISDEARAAIDRALKATGYQRRGQKTAGQRYIEVVFQDLDTIWALEVLRGVLRETRHSPDISVITTESGTRQHPDDDWITGMLRRKPFGVIFIFANLTEREKGRLQDNGIPYVIFDPSGEPSNDDFSVQADNWAGGVLATRHLLALGHTRIGIITGPEEMMCSRARLDGYTSALAEQGIELDPELVTEGDFTTEGGYAQAMALLENPNRPTAIFAGSDRWASMRPPGRTGCASPKTFLSSGSTTCRHPPSWVRRSPPCANPCTTWRRSRRACSSTRRRDAPRNTM